MLDSTPRYTPTILLETINPQDMLPDELQELAEELRAMLPDVDVYVAYEDQHGAGVTWFEVLHIFIPDREYFTDGAYDLLLGAAGAWMRARFNTRGNEKRPKSITIHDQEGNIIGSFELESKDGEMKSEEPKQKMRRKRPRPRHKK